MAKARRGIQSIEVGGTLLQALVDQGAAMALGDLARKAGMSPAKAHPYLVSFGKLGLIEQDAGTGHYALGRFALQLGLISLQRLDPVRIAIPESAALAAELQHTVALAVAGSHGPTIVYLHESGAPIHVNMRTGTVMSIVNTATGRVFAAYLPPKTVAQLVARESGDGAIGTAATQARIGRDELDARVAEVRRHALARTVNRPIPGIAAISAPVFDHRGQLVLALTVIGPTGLLDTSWGGAAARTLAACAQRISSRLGYRDRAPPGGRGT
jgi:DNA-binding IclR family transcriptional regulator